VRRVGCDAAESGCNRLLCTCSLALHRQQLFALAAQQGLHFTQFFSKD